MATNIWDTDAEFQNPDSNIDASGDAVRFGYGDEFTRSKDVKAGGDGAVAGTTWKIVNSGNLSAMDINSTNAGKLTGTNYGNVDMYGTTKTAPILYKELPDTTNFTVESKVTQNEDQQYEQSGMVHASLPYGGGSDFVRLSVGNNGTIPHSLIHFTTIIPGTNLGSTNTYWKAEYDFTAETVTYYAKVLIGDSWTQIGTAESTSAFTAGDYMVGLYGLTANAVGNLVNEFDYFRVTGIAGTGTVQTNTWSPGLGSFDMSTLSLALLNEVGGNTAKLRYSIDGAAFSGAYKTEATLQAEGNVAGSSIQWDIELYNDGANGNIEVTSITLDHVTDITPPGPVTLAKDFNYAGTNTHAVKYIVPVDLDYSHSVMRAIIDGTTYYLHEHGFLFLLDADLMQLTGQGNNNDASSAPLDGYVFHDVIGTDIAFYIATVDTSGNRGAWTLAAVEVGGGGLDIDTTLKKSGVAEVAFDQNDTVEVTGNVESSIELVGVDFVINIRRLSDDVLISNLVTTTTNIAANTPKTFTAINGAAVTYLADTLGEYYAEVALSGGTPNLPLTIDSKGTFSVSIASPRDFLCPVQLVVTSKPNIKLIVTEGSV